MNDLPHQILRQYWGYDSFKPPQEEIIRTVVAGKDVLAVLPTGFGKSLIYQVAGLARGGLTVVISPLIALMEEQTDDLLRRGIKATALTGNMSRQALRTELENVRFGQYRFLFMSPERLKNRIVQNHLPHMPVTLLVVDEAHCVSEWGHDFRPEYLDIGPFRENLNKVPILALTATAQPAVRDDIIRQLRMKDPAVFVRSFYRPNIRYAVHRTSDKLNTLHALLPPGQTAIVYVNSRRRAEKVSRYLQSRGHKAGFFHGGLTYEDKKHRLQQWLNGRRPVMVATSAFGMGINKADVRHVVHFDLPWSLEQYVQESGRAGRDGHEAFASILYDDRDLAEIRHLMESQWPSFERIRDTYARIMGRLGIPPGEGEGSEHWIDLRQWATGWDMSVYTLYSILKILEKYGLLRLEEGLDHLSKIHIPVSPASLRQFLENEADQSPHWQVLLWLTRSFPQIFDEEIRFSPRHWATRWEIDRADLERYLDFLARQGWIRYEKGRDKAALTVLSNRDDYYLNMHREAIRRHMEIKREKVRKVQAYLHTVGCRVGFMKSYFGEEEGFICHRCDNCLKSQDDSSALSRLKRLLQQPQGYSRAELLKYFPDHEWLDRMLEKWMDSRRIRMDAHRRYHWHQ